MSRERDRLVLAALLLAAVLAPVGAQAGPPPPQLTITQVTADLAGPVPTLTIAGKNFGTSPRVWIGADDGTLNEQDVLASDAHSISAALTVVAPGTYLLVVTSGPATTQASYMDVTLGSTGPAGPPGPSGGGGLSGHEVVTAPFDVLLDFQVFVEASINCPPGKVALSGAHEPSPTGFLIPPRASVPLTDGTGWRLVFPKAFGTASGTLYAVCADA